MKLSVETSGDLRILTICAERIDAASAIRFKDSVREATSGWTGRVLLDMSAVDFIDSSGLGAIVSSMKALEGDHGLELCGLSQKVVKVFRLTRMETVFTIHPNVDSARTPGTSVA